jgi:putative copper export protein
MESFSFGSTSGSTFAFYFFLLLALFVGFAIYRLLLEPRLNKMLRPSMPRVKALLIGAAIALLVFLGIYFSSLDGFYQLNIRANGEEIRLGYILPKRTLTLRRSEIAEVRRVPSYKGRWQLILYTGTGAQFTSAHADYASTRKAWEYLRSQLELPEHE